MKRFIFSVVLILLYACFCGYMSRIIGHWSIFMSVGGGLIIGVYLGKWVMLKYVGKNRSMQ